MIASRWTPAELRRVPIRALHSYLRERGWQDQPSVLPYTIRFENPEILDRQGRTIPIVVADTDRFPDYPLTVLDFLSAIGGIYDVDPTDVFAELTAAQPATA